MPAHAAFRVHQTAVRTVLGLVGRYQLTIAGPAVVAAHSDLDVSLPQYSVRVSADGEELLIQSSEWVGHEGEIEARVVTWLLGHVDLRGTRLRKARRADPVWAEAWRRANPGGRSG